MVVVIKPQFIAHEDDKARPTTIFSLDVSPDGQRLATAGLDQKIKVWSTAPILDEEKENDPSCKRLLSTLGSHNGNVLSVRWSPDGQYLASGSDDFITIIWELDENAYGRKVFGQAEENVEVWKPVRRLVGHESDVMSLAWSNDGYWLATGGSDRMILIWDAQTFALVKRIAYHEGMIKGLAFDPAGEMLTSQSDDQSICVWRTTDWSLLSRITDPFVNSPNASWFRRLSWSPEGTFLAVPNSVNNGVFVAGILARKDWAQATSLIGHESVIDVAAFNPVSFMKNPNKPANGSNLCAVLAIAARNCISVWLTSQVRPIVVFDTIVDRDALDLSWSRDGTTLYASSSEGKIAVMQFELKELGYVAPAGAKEAFLETWKFKRAPRTSGLLNGAGGSSGGTADRPNMLMARKGKNASRAASEALLPIPPPGAPQNITINKDGKRRIQPAFLGLGGIVAQPLSSHSTTSAAIASSSSSGVAINALYVPPLQEPSASTSASIYQPMPTMAGVQHQATFDSGDESMSNGMHTGTHLQGPYRTSLQGVGVPSWGAPQERPVQHAQYSSAIAAGKKRRLADYEDEQGDPAILAPYRPPGRTLGGDRQFAPFEGENVELQPAYIPTTTVDLPEEELGLAVPAVKAFQSFKWDVEDEEAEKLEVRNYADKKRSSEIAQINSKGKVQWLDYLPSYLVNVTFTPHFSAISCVDKSLHVYSPNGRRIMPVLVLDAPCAFIDGAGSYLLALTARGTLAVWDVRRHKATFRPTSVSAVVALASRTPLDSDAEDGEQQMETESEAVSPVIVSVKVRANGCPVLSLSNGSALGYDGSLESWTVLSTGWWAKGSEYWEGRTNRSTSAAKDGRGLIRLMESEANDWLLAAQKRAEEESGRADTAMDGGASGSAEGGREGDDAGGLKASVEGEEQAKLGNEDDWKTALTLGHLESRLAAAVALDSLQEYRSFLALYARKLSEEAFRGKAEELVKDLLGPVYHRPGRDENAWQPTILGVSKHTLLKEVTGIWGKSRNFGKLASDTNETLKKMASDA